jgi:hypothetical protein
MKPQDSIRIVSAIAPAAIAAPPIAMVAALFAVGLLWLLSEDKPQEKPEVAKDEDAPPVSSSSPKPQSRKLMREDLAEALAYGERALTRKEAIEALEALGFRKTAAYKALSGDGKFASLMTFSPDGLIEWNG